MSRWREIMNESQKAKEIMLTDQTRGEQMFRGLFDQYPQDGMVYFKRGEAFEAIAEKEQAVSDYAQAEKLFPMEKWKEIARNALKRISSQEEYKKCPLCSAEVGVKAICSNCQVNLTYLKSIRGDLRGEKARLILGNGFFTIISPEFKDTGGKEIINFNSIEKFGYKMGWLKAYIRFSTDKHIYEFSTDDKQDTQDFVDFAFQKFPLLKEKEIEFSKIPKKILLSPSVPIQPKIEPSSTEQTTDDVQDKIIAQTSGDLDIDEISMTGLGKLLGLESINLVLKDGFIEIIFSNLKDSGGKQIIPLSSIKQFGYVTSFLGIWETAYASIRFITDEHSYTFTLCDKKLTQKFIDIAFQRFPLLKEKETEYSKIPTIPTKIVPRQLICRTCHIVVSENAQVCPACGESLPWIDFICPECNSTRIKAKNINFWGGVLLQIVTGAMGSLAGLKQIGNIDVTCNNCGHMWIVDPKDVKPYIVDKTKILPIDSAKTGVSGSDSNQIIELIKKLATLKEQGIMTEEEFMKKKEELLKKI